MATTDTRKESGIAEILNGLVAAGVQLTPESERLVTSALADSYDRARLHAYQCAEANCDEKGFDWFKVSMMTPSGSMLVEVILCEMHAMTLDMLSFGKYMLLERKKD